MMGLLEDFGVETVDSTEIVVHGSRVGAGALGDFFAGGVADTFLGENLAGGFQYL
nr:hypothetical protein [Ferribacterium limneticum]